MIVKDLINLLQKCDPNTVVYEVSGGEHRELRPEDVSYYADGFSVRDEDTRELVGVDDPVLFFTAHWRWGR